MWWSGKAAGLDQIGRTKRPKFGPRLHREGQARPALVLPGGPATTQEERPMPTNPPPINSESSASHPIGPLIGYGKMSHPTRDQSACDAKSPPAFFILRRAARGQTHRAKRQEGNRISTDSRRIGPECRENRHIRDQLDVSRPDPAARFTPDRTCLCVVSRHVSSRLRREVNPTLPLLCENWHIRPDKGKRKPWGDHGDVRLAKTGFTKK